MNFVPRPVMKSHSSHEDSRPLPGHESNKRSKWDRFYRRFAHGQPYLRVFTRSDRFIAEYLGVMLVMHKSVSLKYALEGQGHQNARENDPATNTSQHVNGSHFGRPLQIVPRRSRGWSLRPSRSETPLPDRHSLVIAFTPWGS